MTRVVAEAILCIKLVDEAIGRRLRHVLRAYRLDRPSPLILEYIRLSWELRIPSADVRLIPRQSQGFAVIMTS